MEEEKKAGESMNNQKNQLRAGNIFVRKRITRLFQEAEDRSLIQVNAGAGYGKTQSVLSYISDLDAHVVWVSFTPMDNYTIHFWNEFSNSFESVNHELSDKIKKLRFPEDYISFHHFVKILAAEVYRDKPFVLVFDDCHIINNPAVTDFLSNIISLNIENLTVFLLSRDEVLFYKTYGSTESVYILTEEQLAFTLDEINEYFSQLNIVLPLHTINEIYKETEGWPIAVSLSALSILENPQVLDLPWKMRNQLLFDIIEKEIFSKHSPFEQKALIKLSLFDSFPSIFVEKLTNETGKDMEVLHFSNSLIRYNPHTKSYQFHQLFREFLQDKLFLLSEQEIRKVYEVAGKLFIELNMDMEALNCYWKLKDYETLLNIILKVHARLRRIPSDIGEFIMKIIESFPEDFVEKNPLVRNMYGLSWDWIGKFAKATLEYKKIIDDLKQKEHNEQNVLALGEAYLLLGLNCMLDGDISFCEHFSKAYQYLPEGSQILGKRWMIISSGAAITLKDGNEHEMEDWIRALEESSVHLEHLLHKSTYGFELIAKAEAAYYQSNFKDAGRYASQALYCGKEEILVDIVCNSYYILSKIAIAKGEYQQNIDALEGSKDYYIKYNTESAYITPEIAEGFYYSRIERLNRVPDVLINEQIYNKTYFVSLRTDRIIKANCMLTQEKFFELIPYLDKTEELYIASNQYIALIYVYILKAIVYYNMGDKEQLLSAFLKAYNKSYKNNIIMPFVEYGRYMRTLIYQIRSHEEVNIPEGWLDMIYSKATTYAKRLNYLRRQHDNMHFELQEKKSLSKLEINILIGMSHGLTREEIAESENISLNTVKSQIKNIYSKLGAINGMHAVSNAIEQGIINN